MAKKLQAVTFMFLAVGLATPGRIVKAKSDFPADRLTRRDP